MSRKLSKIGLEASKYNLDNNCGEYLNRNLFYKIRKMVCHYTEKSILAVFPFYEEEEYDSKITKSEFFQYFRKNFLQKKQNSSVDFKTATILLDDHEFIESIDVVVSKNQNLNEGTIQFDFFVNVHSFIKQTCSYSLIPIWKNNS